MPDLIVMRHSKSAYPIGVADHDRPLNERGSRDAKAAREWFAQARVVVDEAWVSSAERAQQTWAWIAPGVHSPDTLGPRVVTVPSLYEASQDGLLSLLRQSSAQTLLVLAHNPGLEQLIGNLVGRDPEGWLTAISTKFPTGAICVMRLESWAHLARGQAELISYVVPRAN